MSITLVPVHALLFSSILPGVRLPSGAGRAGPGLGRLDLARGPLGRQQIYIRSLPIVP